MQVLCVPVPYASLVLGERAALCRECGLLVRSLSARQGWELVMALPPDQFLETLNLLAREHQLLDCLYPVSGELRY